MQTKCNRSLAIAAGLWLGALAVPASAVAENVPDALSVEWQGVKPCEKLYEDAQIRVARCTFPPGSVHLCHSHPSYTTYVLSGGKGQVQNQKGTRELDIIAGSFAVVPPIPWHQFANIGNTTIQYLVVEKKYEPAPPVSQAECPKSVGPRSQ